MALVLCAGEGSLYRAVAPLQGAYFEPPSDRDAGWSIEQERRNKLTECPPIEHGRDRRRTRSFALAR